MRARRERRKLGNLNISIATKDSEANQHKLVFKGLFQLFSDMLKLLIKEIFYLRLNRPIFIFLTSSIS